jgi:hypothetical protein
MGMVNPAPIKGKDLESSGFLIALFRVKIREAYGLKGGSRGLP